MLGLLCEREPCFALLLLRLSSVFLIFIFFCSYLVLGVGMLVITFLEA